MSFFSNALAGMGLTRRRATLPRDTQRGLLDPQGRRARDAGVRGHGPVTPAPPPSTKENPMHEHTHAELDRIGLQILREMAAERLNGGPRVHQHEPCVMCGMSSSPEWRGPSRKRGLGLLCGRCGEWVYEETADPRDIAAAVLTGLSTQTRRTVKRGLGERLGLTYFSESDRTEPNTTPWAHVAIADLRDQVQALAAENYLRLPHKWDPNACVTW